MPGDAERSLSTRLRNEPTERALPLRALNQDGPVAALDVLQRRLALLGARGRGVNAFAPQVELDEAGELRRHGSTASHASPVSQRAADKP